MAAVPTIRTTTTGRATSVIPATPSVAWDGRTATAMKITGIAARSRRSSKNGILRTQATA